ncbi:VanZ family protein [Endozoicomonas atrinae]|uniref:VanZ family protein n=1 Tax=Endozoicomonas atrinae TaxID=1333660 RepID=UPI0008246D77|nr:VanZ family protein [Endozoicomonas atrinae]
MNELINWLQALPPEASLFAFFTALAFALFMAVIPGRADPTRFVNDKFKHAVTFLVLFIMLDLAYPTPGMPWWKPVGLFAFGVFIEFCQKLTGHRNFSIGDIIANFVGIMSYLGLYAVYQGDY